MLLLYCVHREFVEKYQYSPVWEMVFVRLSFENRNSNGFIKWYSITQNGKRVKSTSLIPFKIQIEIESNFDDCTLKDFNELISKCCWWYILAGIITFCFWLLNSFSCIKLNFVENPFYSWNSEAALYRSCIINQLRIKLNFCHNTISLLCTMCKWLP